MVVIQSFKLQHRITAVPKLLRSKPPFLAVLFGKKLTNQEGQYRTLPTQNDSSPLTDPVRWLLDVGPFATGAATRAGEALPVLKNISAHQTPGRSDIELFPLGRYGARNMRKMFINLLFPDSRRLGKLPGAHLLFTQEDNHLLANRLHVIPMFF